MKHPLDKWSRDYNALLTQQAQDLKRWEAMLRPEVYADLAAFCRRVNRPVTAQDLAARTSLSSYTAGGIHVCPVGGEFINILFDRSRYEDSVHYVASSSARLVKASQLKTMKNIATKIAAIAVLFTELAAEFENLPAGGASASEDPKEALKTLAGTKEEALVTKILKKKFAADSIDELDDNQIEKATALISELDDAEGTTEETKADAPEEITLESLQELASELITNGKSSQIKAVLAAAPFKVKKISEIKDAALYPKLDAKLRAIK